MPGDDVFPSENRKVVFETGPQVDRPGLPVDVRQPCQTGLEQLLSVAGGKSDRVAQIADHADPVQPRNCRAERFVQTFQHGAVGIDEKIDSLDINTWDTPASATSPDSLSIIDCNRIPYLTLPATISSSTSRHS